MSEFPPSEKRRREARRAGRVAVSPLAVALGGLAGAAIALYATRNPVAELVAGFARAAFSGTLPSPLVTLREIFLRAFLPIALAAFAGAAAVGLAQSRALFTLGAFSRRKTDDEPRFLVGWAAAAILLVVLLAGAREFLRALAHADSVFAAARVVSVAMTSLGGRALALLAVAGAADWIFRRQQLERALMMTRAERRAEERAEEGDPRLRAERRRRHRQILSSDDLAGAQVIVTSADGAAALREENGEMKIVAIAHGVDATRLVETARRLGLPIRADDAGLLRARRR